MTTDPAPQSADRGLGVHVDAWAPPDPPPLDLVLEGRFARLVPLRAADHAASLHEALRGAPQVWDYLGYGPFPTSGAYAAWMRSVQNRRDPLFLAITDQETGLCGGVAAFLRIAPGDGTIEVGHIHLSPGLQRTRAATETMALMMAWAFDAGYRRYEWKCNALNVPSRAAAQRLGLSYEGTFRQAGVVKGRNRDTAWFAAIDRDWPALRAAFTTWLDLSNFDADGRQKVALRTLTEPVLVTRDPADG